MSVFHRRSVTVLAARVRTAHAARIWIPLGHGSWAAYCQAEFDINPAYRARHSQMPSAMGIG
ncbi:hypothetical protein [Streptomyces sp. NPDC088915]|uniref:hypothetical protein n=1 Tax=Streptomyces sp. NPDC088915 TaxID=3365912 RepID=UPI00381564AF